MESLFNISKIQWTSLKFLRVDESYQIIKSRSVGGPGVNMLSNRVRHVLHCLLLFSMIGLFQLTGNKIQVDDDFDPWTKYGYIFTVFLYFIRILPFLGLPQILFNFLGLTLFNAFPDKVSLKGSPLIAPFICVRVVTRGNYPALVKQNVQRNLAKCLDAGLEHFIIEVVTDKPINLMKDRRIQETVIPDTYVPKSGAMFKSRALQYCLEEGVNTLNDNDYIVHLDEETLLTENSINGIINFILDGKHQFGQGVITYANEEVVNWFFTLADSYRVADDMGKLRFQLLMFHKPMMSWKGSYVVSQVRAERDVSYDNGPDGSVAEDCFFAMKAMQKGYSFNFIEGEMWEKSPFTLWDFLQQRKRWLQGIYLTVHSKDIPFKTKFFIFLSIYAWMTMPLSTSNIIFAALYPIPVPWLMDSLSLFTGAVCIYMYVYGVFRSISPYRFGLFKFCLCILVSLSTMPLNILMENCAVIWGLIGKKHKFYIVNKDVEPVLYV